MSDNLRRGRRLNDGGVVHHCIFTKFEALEGRGQIMHGAIALIFSHSLVKCAQQLRIHELSGSLHVRPPEIRRPNLKEVVVLLVTSTLIICSCKACEDATRRRDMWISIVILSNEHIPKELPVLLQPESLEMIFLQRSWF